MNLSWNAVDSQWKAVHAHHPSFSFRSPICGKTYLYVNWPTDFSAVEEQFPRFLVLALFQGACFSLQILHIVDYCLLIVNNGRLQCDSLIPKNATNDHQNSMILLINTNYPIVIKKCEISYSSAYYIIYVSSRSHLFRSGPLVQAAGPMVRPSQQTGRCSHSMEHCPRGMLTKLLNMMGCLG